MKRAGREDPGRPEAMDRREFLRRGLSGAILAALGLVGAKAAADAARESPARSAEGQVWQIDPYKCVHCGSCGKSCVLGPSAVKCVHAYDVCGYCDLCGAYYSQGARVLDTGAEGQLCPVAALKRSFVEDPYFQYAIDEASCVGCARCVRGCAAFGNASLFLQVRHDRCVNCNDCAAARGCPAGAIGRVPRSKPYILKKGSGHA